MSTVGVPPVSRPLGDHVFVKRRRQARTIAAVTVGRIALFGGSFLVYFGLGYHVVVQQHVVVGDSLARLAHAYFVWWNVPGKLTAVGFVWPPLTTLVYLPVALIKPLSTSLGALPLTSALFAAGLLVVLERILAQFGVPVVARYLLVILFGINPMIVFYATNGMGEMVYLLLLTAGFGAFMRWLRDHDTRDLVISGLLLAAGSLARYELLIFSAALAVTVVIVLVRRRASRNEVEGSLLAFLSPVAYALGIWGLFNWVIMGDPLYFFRSEASAFHNTLPPHGLALVGHVASLSWQLLPLTLVIAGVLALVSLRRRALAPLIVAAIVIINEVFTIAGLHSSHDSNLLQLRYNMRPMPLALAGVGWLYFELKGRKTRMVILAGAAALLLAALPMTWHLMETWPQQFDEQAFARALSTNHDQEGTLSRGKPPYYVGVGPERQMGQYIETHVTGLDAILVDDEVAYGVMLLSGRPDLFYDRIDRGDAHWRDILTDPRGRVGYFLVSNPSTKVGDRIRAMYPNAVGGVPWLRTVYSNSRWVLLRVVPRGFGARSPAAVVHK
jgi:hypothetical protein